MKILAVTCHTGDRDLCRMTDEACHGLAYSTPKGCELLISTVAQGAERGSNRGLVFKYPENIGFSFGMNKAIERGLDCHHGEPDYILCFNNDLQFSHEDWLSELLKESSPHIICVPATDRTAIRIQAGPVDAPSLDLHEMSAYCWLVPFKWSQWLKEQYGYWLFDEEFESYGSDNWAAFLFSKKYGETPFRWVRKSWVKHLRGQTSAVVKPDRRKSNRVLVAKLKRQLKYPNLRPDLRKWAQSYIKILTPRC